MLVLEYVHRHPISHFSYEQTIKLENSFVLNRFANLNKGKKERIRCENRKLQMKMMVVPVVSINPRPISPPIQIRFLLFFFLF